MNQKDLDKIEEELEIKLPEIYSDTLLSYPFKKFLNSTNWSLWDDAEAIIECTKEHRNGYCEKVNWPKNLIYIGDAEDACPYALNIESGSVVKTDHSDFTATPIASYEKFDEFLDYLQECYDEI